jgi:hypothetical protein
MMIEDLFGPLIQAGLRKARAGKGVIGTVR